MDRPGAVERWASSAIGRFVLTGILGAALAAGFQIAGDFVKREAEQRTARRAEALLLVDSVGTLLNEGYYVFGRYFDAAANQWTGDSARRADSAFAAFNERFEKREAVWAARICSLTDSATTALFWSAADELRLANPLLREFRAGKATNERAMLAINAVRDSTYRLIAVLASQSRIGRRSADGGLPRCPVPRRL